MVVRNWQEEEREEEEAGGDGKEEEKKSEIYRRKVTGRAIGQAARALE